MRFDERRLCLPAEGHRTISQRHVAVILASRRVTRPKHLAYQLYNRGEPTSLGLVSKGKLTLAMWKELFALDHTNGKPLLMPCALTCGVLLVPLACLAGPKVTLGKNVPETLLVAIDQIDHSRWDSLLQQFVDEHGNVAYASWKQSREATLQLDKYLATLSTANPSAATSRNAALAYWINAYNAVTVRGILREYPTSSILNHRSRTFGYNIWRDLLLPVGRKSYSLEQIEHDVLRPMREPRIHFAIVCASVGCPRLLNKAYTKGAIDDQLTENAKNFFANANNFRYDAARRQFYLSSILNWFGKDFGPDRAAQLKAIAPYLPDRNTQEAAMANPRSVTFLDYDWGLNDQARFAK